MASCVSILFCLTVVVVCLVMIKGDDVGNDEHDESGHHGKRDEGDDDNTETDDYGTGPITYNFPADDETDCFFVEWRMFCDACWKRYNQAAGRALDCCKNRPMIRSYCQGILDKKMPKKRYHPKDDS